ncbi:hypothetical protein U6Z35_12820 [Bacillus subtilis]|uniref:hypothetical protein n=1 Tax=Bacillus subtilis TaxID=1423 RepID=UPI0023EA9AEA|nr:hypothetical protein [Bacillus subtilis]MDF4199513.1 hypothetical protein [Bacillus subtilis]MDF4216625.1 hypothetical protein [Bacillus subtilis]MDK1001463.1 hypothetical protein [Bacillus subtilis]MEA1023320.1 hypothetical protein [Bacillus subtilis]
MTITALINIEQIQWAITNGIDEFCYFPWSAIDLISSPGYLERYNGIYVNQKSSSCIKSRLLQTVDH